MYTEISRFFQTAPGIFVGILILILCIPLAKKLAWKLFSFDDDVRKLLEQKKSSEVRLGKVTEVLAPLLEDFPVDVQKPGTSTLFLGQPVDYIHFDPDEGITFIEIKSANAKLSASQKKLESLVKSGQVSWVNVQVRGKE